MYGRGCGGERQEEEGGVGVDEGWCRDVMKEGTSGQGSG